MATLIENKGSVSLYKGENDSILLEINGKELTLQHPFRFNYNTFWNPVSADLFNDPNSDNDNNILLLWNNLDWYDREEERFGVVITNVDNGITYKAWQVLSFSSENGRNLGGYDIYGTFLTPSEWDDAPIETLYYTGGIYDNLLSGYYGDIYISHKNSGALSNLTDLEAYNYIASNNDLISAFGIDIEAAKTHYTNHGISEGRSLTAFSASNYLAKYSDLFAAFGDDQTSALKHYIQHGYAEGRTDSSSGSSSGSDSSSSSSSTTSSPTALSDFEALNYIASYSDLIDVFGIDTSAASSHYVNNGYSEGRAKDDFDEWGYLASNNDLMNVFGSNTTEAIKHYISYGKSEGRSTNIFDAESYLNNYSDLKSAFGEDHTLATKHYVEHGFNEGRSF